MTKHRGFMPRNVSGRNQGRPCKQTARLYQRHERREVDRQEFWRTYGTYGEQFRNDTELRSMAERHLDNVRALDTPLSERLVADGQRTGRTGTLYFQDQEIAITSRIDIPSAEVDYAAIEARILAFLATQDEPVPVISFTIDI